MALTDQVIMPGSDYQAICDATRSLTNTTGVLKSGEIASKILSGKSSLPFRKVTTLQISDGVVTFSSEDKIHYSYCTTSKSKYFNCNSR